MTKPEIERSEREILIKPEKGQTLQYQITEAIKSGVHKIVLEGTFTTGDETTFSLLTLTHNIEIDGRGETILDGQNRLAHHVFIDDGMKVKIKGISFVNGNTASVKSQLNLTNHPKSRLNIFRYLDGGAITIGSGSELILENCNFENNHSAVCGGAISNLGGCLYVIGCRFKKNTCGDTGAAIDNLATGSITVIENSQFANNRANLLGVGTYGAVTVFPNTYLVVRYSDFTLESATAIDYKPNKNGTVFMSLDEETKFNSKNPNAVLKNPKGNQGTRKEILTRYVRLLANHPQLVKLERIPIPRKDIIENHKDIFNKLSSGQQI